MKFRFLFFGVFCLLLTGCNYIKTNKPVNYAARVNDTYLTLKEIETVTPGHLSAQDSVIFVRNYINRWATKQLLLESAKQNLSNEKQQEFMEMVNDYRRELFTEAYKEGVIAQQMDTLVTDAEIRNYFEKSKDSYKLQEDILKLRYIKIAEDFDDIKTLKKSFERFNLEDQDQLNSNIYKTEEQFLNDSLWLRSRDVFDKIEILNTNKDKVNIKKDEFIELKDSLSLYLIFVKDVRHAGDDIPLSFLEPQLKQLILNRRKLQFEKQFEKKIIEDALDDNKFEIYD